MGEGDCIIVGQGAGNNPQLVKLIVAGPGNLVYVQGETEFLVKNDPQVPDRILEVNIREGHRNRARVNASQTSAPTQPDNWVLEVFRSRRLDASQSQRALIAWHI